VVRPFRFGVSCGVPASGAAWTELARRLEGSGVATMLVADHLSDVLSPMPALAAAAAATTTLRVGPLVLNNDFRNPTVLAWEAATIDRLSEGRLELGLGAGHMKSEYDLAGIPFEPAAARVARLATAVATIKAVWTDSRSGCPACVQAPHPPLLIGGNGPRLLELAAREASIVGFAGFSPRRGGLRNDLGHFGHDGLAERIALVRTAAGERFADLELSALVQRVVVTDDQRVAAEALSTEWKRALSPEQALECPFLFVGNHDQIGEQLQARRDTFGVTYWTVFEKEWEGLAPVIARLAGT